MARAAAGKTRTTAWGSSFRAPPPILHGYDKKVSGTTASERLDLRRAGGRGWQGWVGGRWPWGLGVCSLKCRAFQHAAYGMRVQRPQCSCRPA